MPELRLHDWLPASYANGPGRRAVLWLQGCSLGCPGCFNPETHAPSGGQLVTVEAMAERLLALSDIDGLTVSGGEPLQQAPALLALLQRLRSSSLSVLVFTGFSWEEVQHLPQHAELLACIDVLITGRYQQERRLARGLLGSANKQVHFLSERYGPADLESVPPAEIVITAQGELLFSGIDPADLA